MRRISKERIQPGFRLPGALRDDRGAILIAAGVELTHHAIEQLAARQDMGALFGHTDWPADAPEAAPLVGDDASGAAGDSAASQAGIDVISTASLRPGMRLAQDLYDHSDVLLLAAGMQVTPRFLSLLSQRQIKTVRIRTAPPPDLTAVYEEEDDPIDVGVENHAVARDIEEALPDELNVAPAIHAVRAWRRPRLPLEALRSEAARGLERHAATSAIVADVGETLQGGGRVSCRKLQGTVRSFVDMVSVDFDLLPLIVSMQRTRNDYLFDHCVNTSLLSMTIAAQLGLGHEEVMDVGLGGLLQDIGMLRVPTNIRLAPRRVTPKEWNEIQRHPLHTLDMLENIPGLPAIVRIICYQAHERGDGTGYPRGRNASTLHPFAMIVAMADMFAAMTRPRPYRPAQTPYEATRAILIDGSVQKFDQTLVRAFLDAVSLFPIGSVVELNTGTRARVIRANADHHTRPIVERLDDRGQPLGQIIDLSSESDVKVVRAYAQPDVPTAGPRGEPAFDAPVLTGRR